MSQIYELVQVHCKKQNIVQEKSKKYMKKGLAH